jgi:hypothetical protein
MKKKDLSTIGAVAVASAIISFILSGMLFSTPDNRKQNVEIVEPISTKFERPDAMYFNESSINPAQNIQIGTDQNSNPFGSE